MSEEFKEKVRSLGFPRRSGQSETRQVVEAGRKVATETEHWDGRQDATVFPNPIRMNMRMHKAGKKKGQVAEVREMTSKERREKYGD